MKSWQIYSKILPCEGSELCACPSKKSEHNLPNSWWKLISVLFISPSLVKPDLNPYLLLSGRPGQNSITYNDTICLASAIFKQFLRVYCSISTLTSVTGHRPLWITVILRAVTGHTGPWFSHHKKLHYRNCPKWTIFNARHVWCWRSWRLSQVTKGTDTLM